jgi:putative flavoprotein involved in K+ transport
MDLRQPPERIDTVVIGAGQAGLSAGYHLARRGTQFVILDADRRVGDHWRERWDSLRLYSPAVSDALPGMRFPAPGFHYPSGVEMGDYLEAYARQFDLPVRSDARVQRLEPASDADGGFIVSTRDRRWLASKVIVASGAFRRPYVPDVAAHLDPSIRQLHSTEYRNPSQLRDGPVLVVGVGHSGADIAHEIAQTHPTILSGRAGGQLPFRVIDTWRMRILWPLMALLVTRVLTIRTPIGRRMRAQVRGGTAPLLRVRREDLEAAGVQWHEARTVGARDGKPLLADGQVLDITNVIWCTGYRPDYDWIKIPDLIGEDGWPREVRGVSTVAEGLYFLGVPFQYGFGSMLVVGAARDADYVVKHMLSKGTKPGRPAVSPAAVA